MYIAVVQNNPRLGALRENAQKAIDSIKALALCPYPPDLVIFPAYALTGTPVEGLQFSDSFAAESLDVARYIIENASLPTLIGTMIPRPMPDDMAFISEPEVLFCREKAGGALGFVDIGNSWEAESYASSITTVIDGHTISVLLDEYPEIDEDFSEPEIVILMLAKEYQGSKSMFTASDQLGYVRDFAKKNASWVIVANLVGAQDASVYDGASVVIRPDGSIAEALAPFEEGMITCNLNLDPPDSQSVRPTAAEDQNEHLVKPLLPYEADWRAIELFIKDYVHKNGFTDVAIGLSGGIDSAVTAALACDALGAEHVHGLLMPGPYSSQESIDDSLILAKNLGIETFTLPIDKPFSLFRSLYQKGIGQKGSSLADQNIQTRIRMIYLMYLSNSFDWLVLNTNNKSESAMGYTTLYGDTAGAIAPLGNVYKTDIYGLANWRNEQSLVIPKRTLSKAPSAELYPNQTDEDSLPPYELLDHVLRLHIEEGLGVDQILLYSLHDPDREGLSSELVEGILDTVKRAEYKRRQGPLSPALGYFDLSYDRDWPVTNGFSDHNRGTLPSETQTDYLGMIDRWEQPGGWDFLAN